MIKGDDFVKKSNYKTSLRWFERFKDCATWNNLKINTVKISM